MTIRSSSNNPCKAVDDCERLLVPMKILDGQTSQFCDSCGQHVDETESPQRTKPDSLSAWAVAICVVCTLINCLLALGIPDLAPALFDPIFSMTRQQYNLLRQPSPPVGPHNDDNIQTISPIPPGTILSYPAFTAQVDLVNKRYINHNGSTSDDGNITITAETSTIVQFGSVDFGIERCELKLRLPSDSEPGKSREPFSISIYQLDTFAPLDVSQNTPRRLMILDTIQIISGISVDWHKSFDCAWGEVLTFEIACSGREVQSRGGCSVEWRQRKNKEDPNNAIFILQHASY